MKLFLPLFLVLFSPMVLQAQLVDKRTIRDMNPAEFEKVLNDIGAKPRGAAMQREMMREAVNFERQDLVMVCLIGGGGESLDTFNLIKQLPDSEFKQRLITQIMRTSSPMFWPNTQPGTNTFHIERDITEWQEPYKSIVEHLLGKLPDVSILNQNASRALLADKLDKAIDARKSQAASSGQTNVRDALNLTSSAIRPNTDPTAATSPVTASQTSFATWWIAGGALLILIVIVFKKWTGVDSENGK